MHTVVVGLVFDIYKEYLQIGDGKETQLCRKQGKGHKD